MTGMSAALLQAAPSVQLDHIFRARSVALVGVSANPDALGHRALTILRKSGFPGKVFLVNPRRADIEGEPCHRDLLSLPETPDVALIMVSAPDVPDIIVQCGRKEIPGAVVVSGGFEEVEGGSVLAALLREAATTAGVAVLGPNCEGVWSVAARLLLTFGSAADRTRLFHAPIAILSQSGSIAGALARHLQDAGIGCSYVASVGNETVLDILDVLEWTLDQPDVRVVALFIEGLRNGGRLLSLARTAASRGIRLVALKSGNSQRGREATATHTGKLASEHRVYRDVFSQAGIIQVDDLSSLRDAVVTLCFLGRPEGRRAGGGVGVFSVPGGTRALTVDYCERYGVPLAVFAPATLNGLSAILPTYARASNPTDMTGFILSNPSLFGDALQLVLEDPNVSSVIVQLANRGPHDLRANIELIKDLASAGSKPIVVSLLGDTVDPGFAAECAKAGVGIASDPHDAVVRLGWLYAEDIPEAHVAAPEDLSLRVEADGWTDGVALLTRLGVPVVPHVVWVGNDPEAAISHLPSPYCLKALPEFVQHKTEAGLVVTGLQDGAALRAAASEMRLRLGNDEAPLLIQAQVRGVEALLALRRDPDFGPVLCVGSGGVEVELTDDVAFVGLPATRDDLERALSRTRLGKRLAGFRGAAPADTDSYLMAAEALARVAADRDCGVFEVELNPLFVLPKGSGVCAVDILLEVR